MAHSYHYFYIGDSQMSESTFSKTSPRLLTFSKIRNGQKGETAPHLHSHLEIFYFESGNGTLLYGDQSLPLKAHDLVVANAQTLHLQYSSDALRPLVYYNFAIDRLQTVGNPPNCISGRRVEHYSLGTGENPFYKIIGEILQEYEQKKYGYYSKVNALFMSFLIDTIRLFSETKSAEFCSHGTVSSVLTEIKKYIDDHYTESLNLETLTKQSYMQKSHFLHTFKKSFGISPIRYLNLVRIEHAKLLLIGSRNSVAEIAREVGFSNPTYFSEMFLKLTGYTPSGYRKSITQHL